MSMLLACVPVAQLRPCLRSPWQDGSTEEEMPAFQEVRHVHHSADEMFDLVADVERYHEFVPLCLRHAILSRESQPESEILMTDMTVKCGIYCQSYISRVTLDRANGRILIGSSDGPLRELRTRWTFKPRSDRTCEVGFYLHYELASPTLALLMGAILDVAFGRFVQAFERRADIVYGRRHKGSSNADKVSVSFS
jgi:coenzyme Q-binding protein COQ10